MSYTPEMCTICGGDKEDCNGCDIFNPYAKLGKVNHLQDAIKLLEQHHEQQLKTNKKVYEHSPLYWSTIETLATAPTE